MIAVHLLRRIAVQRSRMTVPLVILLFAGTGGSLHSNGASRPGYPVAVKVTFPRHEYKEIVRSVKEIDFKNLGYRLFDTRIHLRNGSAKKNQRIEGTEASEHIEVSLKRTWYFDFQDGLPRHALVSLDYFDAAGSSSYDGILLLFTIINGHPVVSQQFDYDRQAPGTGDTFNTKLGLLTIKARAEDDSAHCCPENLETDESAWQGQKFKLRNRKIQKLAQSNN